MTSRADQLKELMKRHNLSCEAVGELLNRKPQTVRLWRCPSANRPIPANELELLRLKVAAQ